MRSQTCGTPFLGGEVEGTASSTLISTAKSFGQIANNEAPRQGLPLCLPSHGHRVMDWLQGRVQGIAAAQDPAKNNRDGFCL